MKRLAVFTDLHADLHALRDALSQIERLHCDAIVCAGDLVDYGVFPEETRRLSPAASASGENRASSESLVERARSGVRGAAGRRYGVVA